MKMKQASTSRWTAATMAFGLLAAASGVAVSAVPVKPAAKTNSDAVAPSGMRAYIDPTTGQLRQPTAEELASEARVSASSASDDGKSGSLVVVRRADGTLRAHDTDGNFMETVVATRSSDGKITLQFVDGQGTSSHVEPAPVVAEEK